MLTEAEIKRIKDGVVLITLDDALRGRLEVIKPTILDNGYKVGYSIDVLRKNLRVHHISVSNSRGMTDPAEAECIARDFLGEEYSSIGPMNFKNVLHFERFDQIKN